MVKGKKEKILEATNEKDYQKSVPKK